MAGFVLGRPGRLGVEQSCPLPAEPLAMPPDDGIGLHDDQGLEVPAPRAGAEDDDAGAEIDRSGSVPARAFDVLFL